MSENPAFTVELDPVTWDVVSIRLQGNSDQEIAKLETILARGIHCEGLRVVERSTTR